MVHPSYSYNNHHNSSAPVKIKCNIFKLINQTQINLTHITGFRALYKLQMIIMLAWAQPIIAEIRKSMKFVWFWWPTQLLMNMQWWSRFNMHRWPDKIDTSPSFTRDIKKKTHISCNGEIEVLCNPCKQYRIGDWQYPFPYPWKKSVTENEGVQQHWLFCLCIHLQVSKYLVNGQGQYTMRKENCIK